MTLMILLTIPIIVVMVAMMKMAIEGFSCYTCCPIVYPLLGILMKLTTEMATKTTMATTWMAMKATMSTKTTVATQTT